MDFKTPLEIIHLLASTAARGGNLLLNVGPDGTGKIPETSLRDLREVGQWLKANGESIYGTTQSPFPDQPWGVGTSKPGRLYLHVFQAPADRALLVPDFSGEAQSVSLLIGNKKLHCEKRGEDLSIELPEVLPDARDSVVVVEYSGKIQDPWTNAPVMVSREFDSFSLDAANARLEGAAKATNVNHSHYFGNWKHDTCVEKMRSPGDCAEFLARFIEPGEYRISLEYACAGISKGREGFVKVGGQSLAFETLYTGEYDNHQPLMMIRHAVGVVSIRNAGVVPVSVYPKADGAELFWLRRVVIEPVR
jgi:alpha-L-fucosidase